MKGKNLFINAKSTGRDALLQINNVAIPNLSLFVVDKENKLKGTVADGDIRRGLISGKEIDHPITDFMNKESRYFHVSENNYQKLIEYKSFGIRFVPIIDGEGRIIQVSDIHQLKANLPIDAVLMAGGRGSRLKPLTDNIPKPLLKVGNIPIIARNLNRLNQYGIVNTYITIRYLKEKMIETLSPKLNSKYFIEEDIPLGTIGSLRLITEFDNDLILLMNSDILTNIDFEDFYKSFEETNADIQIATIPYEVSVPYGVLETLTDNNVNSIVEKPKYTYYTNAGIYLFKRSLLSLIPDEGKFDATDFIEEAIKQGRSVKSYPLYCYWLDIGRHVDFEKAQNDVKHIDF
jgi:dTDP-glucose pyrophosphorylase